MVVIVTPDHVGYVGVKVRWTGIPVDKMLEGWASAGSRAMEDEIGVCVVGQGRRGGGVRGVLRAGL